MENEVGSLEPGKRADLIILDLMLPGVDGLEVCRKLRAEAGKDTPVLMLTARGQSRDRDLAEKASEIAGRLRHATLAVEQMSF